MCKLWDKGTKVAFKKFKVLWSAKGCLPKIYLGTFLNTLSQVLFRNPEVLYVTISQSDHLCIILGGNGRKMPINKFTAKPIKANAIVKYSRKLFLNELYLKSTL